MKINAPAQRCSDEITADLPRQHAAFYFPSEQRLDSADGEFFLCVGFGAYELMNSFLLNRAFGSVDSRSFEKAQTTRLIHHLEPAPGIRFSNERLAARQQAGTDANWDEPEFSSKEPVAHGSGVSCLAIDQEGR